MRPWARVAVVLILPVLGWHELESLSRTLGHQGHVRRVAAELAARQPSIAAHAAAGGIDALRGIASELPAGVASEIEVFDEAGRLLLAYPAPSTVAHRPGADDVQRLRRGDTLTRSVPRPPVRVVRYLPISWAGRPAILRLTAPAGRPASEPSAPLGLVRQFVVLILLLAVGLLALLPPRAANAEEPGGGALRAYEEAMGRLQAHGEAESLRHRQERTRLRSALDDKDAMARAGELTSGIVHEVRNGLATITGYAQLIERVSTGDASDSARRIRDECATLETVVRRFVDFVRSEDLRLAPFDIGRMLARVASREGRSRPGGGVALPEPPPDATLIGDEEMLERAFENLVRNARAAAGEGGHVWINAGDEGGEVIVVIADDGPGMPAEQRAAIRPFTTSKGGLGLGLATALKIVRLHGGDIILSDRRPRGLEATVRLPKSGPRAEA